MNNQMQRMRACGGAAWLQREGKGERSMSNFVGEVMDKRTICRSTIFRLGDIRRDAEGYKWVCVWGFRLDVWCRKGTMKHG